MRSIITEAPTTMSRLLWFAGLYAAGVIVTVGVASVLRAIIFAG